MATYTMDDGRVVKDGNAVQTWDEDTYWDGHNTCSKATGSQWHHEQLHKSKKGNYWIETWSNYEKVTNTARWLTPKEAVAWILGQDCDLPDDLLEYAADICE